MAFIVISLFHKLKWQGTLTLLEFLERFFQNILLFLNSSLCGHREWGRPSSIEIWARSEIWCSLWLLSRQSQYRPWWTPHSNSSPVSIQCHKGWRNCFPRCTGLFFRQNHQFQLTFPQWLLCIGSIYTCRSLFISFWWIFLSRNFLAARFLRTKTIFLIVQRKESLVSYKKNHKVFFSWYLWECFEHLLISWYCSLVKPKKGNALLFFNLHQDAIPDTLSLHGGCPVIEGEKWSATKWIHVDSFDKILTHDGNCTDINESCERWAVLGECAKNPEYMVGTPELPGNCRHSCKAC